MHTFHVLEKIETINPRVIVTEYNAKYGPLIDWTVEYNENAEWDNSDYFGASLHSFEKMLKKEGLFFSWLQCHWSKCHFCEKGFVK